MIQGQMCQIYNRSEKTEFLDSLVNVQWIKSWDSQCTIQEFDDTSDLLLLAKNRKSRLIHA